MASYVDAARHQWEEGSRRLSAEASNPEALEALMEQVEVVIEAIRRRVGEHFTLAQLADVYGGADSWVFEVVSEKVSRPGWMAKLSVAQDAAFHLYARGATDYAP